MSAHAEAIGRPTVRHVLLLAVVLLVVGACDRDLTTGIGVLNATDVELHFQVIVAGGAVDKIVGRVPPGHTGLLIGWWESSLRDGCTVGDLIALDPEGREVARHPPPLCVDDERWVVELPAAIVVRNTTTLELHFQVIGPDGTPVELAGRAGPGRAVYLVAYWEQHLLRDGCTVGDLIAVDPAGREVARHPPPLCGKDLWVVASPAVTPGAS